MYLSFEQLMLYMLAVSANIYITAFLVTKAFGFLTPSGFDNNNISNSHIKDYEHYQVPEEYYDGEVPEELLELEELANAGVISSSDLEYNLSRLARVKELESELEQLKSTTQLKDFINVPDKLEPLTIYDIHEEEANSSDLYDEDVEIITPEYEKFIEDKLRR